MMCDACADNDLVVSFMLGSGYIFSQGVLAEVFDREGVKLLSSECPQRRMTQ